MGYNVNLDSFVAVIIVVAVAVTPHGVRLLSGFVVLQRSEARLITNLKIVWNNPLLQSEEGK